uniref:Hexosyltransferase n=1 Tax=Culicoides sonorensis TaxID=179676 RepID=A0A336LD06_CULSO
MKSTRIFLFLLIFSVISYLIIFQTIDYKEPEVSGWERERSRNVCNYISNNENSALKPVDFCSKLELNPFLLIFVTSDIKNFKRRKIIRETWGNSTRFGYENFLKMHGSKIYLDISESWKNELKHRKITFKTIFILGKSSSDYSKHIQNKVIREEKIHQDVLQEDFIENYRNLTLKTLTMLKWGSKSCLSDSVKFYIKTDDDIFLNVPNLIHTLIGGTIPAYSSLKYFYNDRTIDVLNTKNRIEMKKGLLMGDLWYLTPVLRNPSLKHYTPRYLYENFFFPPFLSGYIFIMSPDIAEMLYDAAMKTPLIHLEDVFVTGILAEKSNITRKRHHLFSFKRLPDLCGLKGILAENGRDPNEFYEAIDFVLDESVKCQGLNGMFVKFLYKVIFKVFEPWISIWNNYKYWLPPKM